MDFFLWETAEINTFRKIVGMCFFGCSSPESRPLVLLNFDYDRLISFILIYTKLFHHFPSGLVMSRPKSPWGTHIFLALRGPCTALDTKTPRSRGGSRGSHQTSGWRCHRVLLWRGLCHATLCEPWRDAKPLRNLAEDMGLLSNWAKNDANTEGKYTPFDC